MSETDLIERLADAMAKHMTPPLPVAVDLWDIKTIAAYLKRAPDVVRNRIAVLPTFPKPIRLPAATEGGRSNPLYKAREVIAWAEKHQAS